MSKRSKRTPRAGRTSRQPQSDADLVGATLRGETAAFDELVRRYQQRTTAVAVRLVGDLDDALEVTQEAFLRAYRNLSALELPERFGSWLLRIVTNLSLNLRRDRASTRRRIVSEPDNGNTQSARTVLSAEQPEDRIREAELAIRVQRVLSELPVVQRAALVLFSVESLPQREVAEILGCSVEAVKWHVFQARRKIRRRIAPHL